MAPARRSGHGSRPPERAWLLLAQPKRAARARNAPGAAPCSQAGKRSHRGTKTIGCSRSIAVRTARAARCAEIGAGLFLAYGVPLTAKNGVSITPGTTTDTPTPEPASSYLRLSAK